MKAAQQHKPFHSAPSPHDWMGQDQQDERATGTHGLRKTDLAPNGWQAPPEPSRSPRSRRNDPHHPHASAKSPRSPPDGRLLRPTLLTTLYAIFLLHIVILTFVYLRSLRRLNVIDEYQYRHPGADEFPLVPVSGSWRYGGWPAARAVPAPAGTPE